jgi:hypothetical protein
MHNKQKKVEKPTVATSEIKELAGYYNKEIRQKEETDNDKFLKHIKNKF